jgi:hypothetical protein
VIGNQFFLVNFCEKTAASEFNQGHSKLLKFARAAIFTPDMTNSGAVLPWARGTRGARALLKKKKKKPTTFFKSLLHCAGPVRGCAEIPGRAPKMVYIR